MSEAVDRWLVFAREDLQVAEVVLDDGLPGRAEVAHAVLETVPEK